MWHRALVSNKPHTRGGIPPYPSRGPRIMWRDAELGARSCPDWTPGPGSSCRAGTGQDARSHGCRPSLTLRPRGLASQTPESRRGGPCPASAGSGRFQPLSQSPGRQPPHTHHFSASRVFRRPLRGSRDSVGHSAGYRATEALVEEPGPSRSKSAEFLTAAGAVPKERTKGDCPLPIPRMDC